jgi:predicted transcriptional regulator
VSRERATGSALNDIVKRMFGGSSEALLMAMVDARQISAEELARVAERLNAAERNAAEEE